MKFDRYKRTLDLEPSSNIEGEAEVYLNVGSSHSIRCLVNSPQPPHHIFWYFQHQVKSKSISFFCASENVSNVFLQNHYDINIRPSSQFLGSLIPSQIFQIL